MIEIASNLARRIHFHRLEAALERAVLLDVLAVFRRRGRADAPDLAAAQRRLEDVRGVERAFRRPGAHQRMELVDEDDDVRVVGQLLHDRLEALFELTAILRARDDERDVECEDALVGEEVRHVAVDDLLRQAFDDGRLADARLANQHGVVLGAAAQHLLDPLQLVIAPDERIELVLHRGLGEVAAELGEERRFLDPRQRRLLVQELHDVVAHRVQPHPLFHQDGGGNGSLLAQDAEQQVLGPDVVVEQPIGLLRRELEDTLGFGAERDFDRCRDLLAKHRPAFNFLADIFERQVGPGEDPAGQAFAFPNEAQQQMLGLDRNAPELACLVAGEEEHAPRSFGVPFEHPASDLSSIIRHTGRALERFTQVFCA